MRSIISRIAEWAIRIWKHDKSVVDELKRINPTIEITNFGFVGKAPDGMKVGIPFGLEPSLAAVQLCFLLFGNFWPQLDGVSQAINLASKAWASELKKSTSGV